MPADKKISELGQSSVQSTDLIPVQRGSGNAAIYAGDLIQVQPRLEISIVAPVNPTYGLHWIDQTLPLPHELKKWNGTAWVKITDLTTYTNFASFPLIGVAGLTYFDETGKGLYIWNGNGYVPYGTPLSSVVSTALKVTSEPTQVARLAVVGASIDDVVIQEDTNTIYQLRNLPSSTNANWSIIGQASGGATAVNGVSVKTGNVVLGQDVGEVGNPGALTSDREIPMAGRKIRYKGSGTKATEIHDSGDMHVGQNLFVNSDTVPGSVMSPLSASSQYSKHPLNSGGIHTTKWVDSNGSVVGPLRVADWSYPRNSAGVIQAFHQDRAVWYDPVTFEHFMILGSSKDGNYYIGNVSDAPSLPDAVSSLTKKLLTIDPTTNKVESQKMNEIYDMRATAVGTPLSYSKQQWTREFRPQTGGDPGILPIPSMDGIVDWWILDTMGGWTTGDYTTQVAYNARTNTPGQSYVFTRSGIDNVTWGPWRRIKALRDTVISATAPTNPQPEEIWIDTGTNQAKVSNGSTWVVLGTSSTVANFASLPGTGVAGTIYVTTDTGMLWKWNGTGYVPYSSVLPNTTGGGAGTLLYSTSGASSTSIDTGAIAGIGSYEFIEILFSAEGNGPSSWTGMRFNGFANQYQDYTATVQSYGYYWLNGTGPLGGRILISKFSGGNATYHVKPLGVRNGSVTVGSSSTDERDNSGFYVGGVAISSIQFLAGNPILNYKIRVIGYN